MDTSSPAYLWARDKERERREQAMLEWEMYAEMITEIAIARQAKQFAIELFKKDRHY